jgi:hypothetical protein
MSIWLEYQRHGVMGGNEQNKILSIILPEKGIEFLQRAICFDGRVIICVHSYSSVRVHGSQADVVVLARKRCQ